MTVLVLFLIFLFVLFCINYTVVGAILHYKKPRDVKEEWEKSIEKEIDRVLQD